MTSYRGAFNIGSLPPIHGKIITSRMDRDTSGLGHGSFKVTRSQNGKHLDRVHYFGFMGNVGCPWALILCRDLALMVSPFRSWGRQECPLVSYPSAIFSSRELTTLVSSTIIQEVEVMRKSGLASLAFYYHDFREDQKKHLRGLLSSVLFQLCAQSDSYSDILSNLYSTHLHGIRSPSDDELFRCLKELLELPGQAPVYLIIDALDECPNTSAIPSPREEILILLEQLIESRFTNLRLCVTSRPEIDIKIVLEPLTFRSISIHDEKGQMEDIENYIQSVVNTGAQSRRWKREDKQLVIDILTKHADGM